MLENWDRITPSKSPGEDSFNTDFNDLATTVAASEITDTIEVGQLTPQQKLQCGSGNQQYPPVASQTSRQTSCSCATPPSRWAGLRRKAEATNH